MCVCAQHKSMQAYMNTHACVERDVEERVGEEGKAEEMEKWRTDLHLRYTEMYSLRQYPQLRT